jgi:hypothetical protein
MASTGAFAHRGRDSWRGNCGPACICCREYPARAGNLKKAAMQLNLKKVASTQMIEIRH